MPLPSKTLRLAAAAAAFAFALPVTAAAYEIEAGRSYSYRDATSAIFFEIVLDPRAIGSSNFSWEPDLTVGWIAGRSGMADRHNRYDIRAHAAIAAVGARFQYWQQDAWYRHLFFSFQPTYNTGRTPGLSSTYEFTSTLGWQGQHFSLQLRHISNGGFHDPNRGETMALAGVNF